MDQEIVYIILKPYSDGEIIAALKNEARAKRLLQLLNETNSGETFWLRAVALESDL